MAIGHNVRFHCNTVGYGMYAFAKPLGVPAADRSRTARVAAIAELKLDDPRAKLVPLAQRHSHGWYWFGQDTIGYFYRRALSGHTRNVARLDDARSKRVADQDLCLLLATVASLKLVASRACPHKNHKFTRVDVFVDMS
jgi:hypothetical protein